MSEPTAEFYLVPRLCEILRTRFLHVLPLFFWSTREGIITEQVWIIRDYPMILCNRRQAPTELPTSRTRLRVRVGPCPSFNSGLCSELPVKQPKGQQAPDRVTDLENCQSERSGGLRDRFGRFRCSTCASCRRPSEARQGHSVSLEALRGTACPRPLCAYRHAGKVHSAIVFSYGTYKKLDLDEPSISE
jgi:hypothetical protein